MHDKQQINPEQLAPPMLARGSFNPKTGVGCVMNLMCWVKNYPAEEVTDRPDNVAKWFREMLISLNDQMCHHLRPHAFNQRQHNLASGQLGTSLNCPTCSGKLISWAFDLAESSFTETHQVVTASGQLKMVDSEATPEEIFQLSRLRDSVNTALNRKITSCGVPWWDKEATDKAWNKWKVPDWVRRVLPTNDHKYGFYYRQFQFPDAETLKRLDQYQAKIDEAMEKLIDYYFTLYRKYNIQPMPFAWETEAAQKAIDAAIGEYNIKTGPETRRKAEPVNEGAHS